MGRSRSYERCYAAMSHMGGALVDGYFGRETRNGKPFMEADGNRRLLTDLFRNL